LRVGEITCGIFGINMWKLWRGSDRRIVSFLILIFVMKKLFSSFVEDFSRN
jgi:hypothetical protein